MRTVFFLPTLEKSSGGLRSILELASLLHRQGLAVAVTAPAERTPGLAELDEGIERLPWAVLSKAQNGQGQNDILGPGDLWCVPESWPNALAPGLAGGARCLVYMQSWNYPLTALPEGVAWPDLPLRYLAVSRPVAWVMREFLGVEAEAVLPPAVDAAFFAAGLRRAVRENNLAPSASTGETVSSRIKRTVRVAWMPRKNRSLGENILRLALLHLAGSKDEISIEAVPVQGMELEAVAAALAGADIFLGTGFPEGFGLPPLEAMAAGCVPVGFSGQGGYEYMRNPQDADYPWLGRPAFALPEQPAGADGTRQFALADGMQQKLRAELADGVMRPALADGAKRSALMDEAGQPDMEPNGLFVSDGDVLAAGLALAEATRLAAAGGPFWQTLRRSATATAANYSLERRAALVAKIWPGFINNS